MRVVLASAIIALAGYSAARPLTVGDVANSAKSGEDTASSGVLSSSSGSSAGSDGIDLSAFGGTSSPSSSSSPLSEVEDDDPLLSSLNSNLPSDSDSLDEEVGSSSAGINSGSGIGSSELEMKFDHLDVPESSSSGFDPTSHNFEHEDEDDDIRSLGSPSSPSDLDVGNGLTMPSTDGFSDMSEEQLRDFVKYLALALKESGELDGDAEGLESSMNGDDESDFAQPISSGSGVEPDWFSANGEDGTETEELSVGPSGLADSQLSPDMDSSPFPNGRQLTSTEQAEVNAF